MRTFFTVFFTIVGTIMFVGGIILLLHGLADRESEAIYIGLGGFIFGPVFWGFNYIVEAAMKYIKDN